MRRDTGRDRAARAQASAAADPRSARDGDALNSLHTTNVPGGVLYSVEHSQHCDLLRLSPQLGRSSVSLNAETEQQPPASSSRPFPTFLFPACLPAGLVAPFPPRSSLFSLTPNSRTRGGVCTRVTIYAFGRDRGGGGCRLNGAGVGALAGAGAGAGPGASSSLRSGHDVYSRLNYFSSFIISISLVNNILY